MVTLLQAEDPVHDVTLEVPLEVVGGRGGQGGGEVRVGVKGGGEEVLAVEEGLDQSAEGVSLEVLVVLDLRVGHQV